MTRGFFDQVGEKNKKVPASHNSIRVKMPQRLATHIKLEMNSQYLEGNL